MNAANILTNMVCKLTADVMAIKLATQYLTFEHWINLVPEDLRSQTANVIYPLPCQMDS